MATISCAVIGEGNLLLCCLKSLQDRGLAIKSIFTNTPCGRQFCENNAIQHHHRIANIAGVLAEVEIDYLFSISNPRILKEDVLRIPKKCTINYHDSPLPRYAGVHATSWAIIHGEERHGISWHVVETGIDTGDILQSEAVDILEDDSALTLNLKCVEAAKRAFDRLLSDITTDSLKPVKQPGTGRTYFGLNALPPGLGVLNFTDSANKVYNLARGLELGNHDNALGSPKVKTASGHFLLVTNSTKSENFVQKLPSDAGKILDIIDDTLVVATSTTPVQISLANLDGTSLAEETFDEHDILVGKRLISTREGACDNDSIISVRKKEKFWRTRLGKYEPTMFYRQKMNVVAGVIDVATTVSCGVVKLKLPPLPADLDRVDVLQASFVSFLGRINCTNSVHIGLVADKCGIPETLAGLYASTVPANFQVDNGSKMCSVLESCLLELKQCQESQTFLTDMMYRYPELRSHVRNPHHNIVIGSSSAVSNEAVMDVLHECNVLILFDKNCREIKVMYHERPAQDYSHITDVLRHFSTFLTAMNKATLETPPRLIPLVSEEEIAAFYQPPPANKQTMNNEKISDFIQTQCKLTPLSIAVKTTTQMITYSKLSEEITCFAEKLKELIPTNSYQKQVMALHLPNSISYVVSLLTLACNDIAFLPLPVDYPADRLVFTLKDAKVQRIIMKKETFDTCDLNGLTNHMKVAMDHKVAGEHLVVVMFDKDLFQTDHNDNVVNSGIDQLAEPIDSDFAYLMYTSGSTGRPKGVKVKESSVINLARAQITCWDIGPGDVIAQFASIGFDASISEIFTCMLSGASLAILNSSERLGGDFVTAMNKMKVSIITLAPSALNIYCPTEFQHLKKVVTAGEACTLNNAVKWTSTGQIRFFNAYGPTETTVCATNYEYVPGTRYEDVNRELPIGKAIENVQVYLFDDFKSPVPPDVIGEIYIGGKGLTHGYTGHAHKFNKDKFVEFPLAGSEAILYKTGDHAFRDADGNLTYVGRTDDQVKIRGHRIDLSEIEQVIIQHPKIDIAVVVVHKCNRTNEQSIAAYIAPTFIYVSELREYLAKVLPRYMVPTYIRKIEVTDFPMTLNGKINRKRLEHDEDIHKQVETEETSHLNETQLWIANLWRQVFKLDESFVYSLHRQSSFSELGGNSLQLVLLLRLIEENLKVDISFTDLGTADTIEEFSEVIRRRRDLKTKSNKSDAKTAQDLREMIFNDSELDTSIFPNHSRRRSVQLPVSSQIIHYIPATNQPRNVLISGVTGFLGAFLLSELLEQTDAHVCCMVRESTEVRGMGRIVDNLRKYGLWKFEYSSRIAVVISDLSQKNMGIAPDIYKSLCNAVDVVFMNAAMMNFNTPYEDHRIANVEGTNEFIKFASTGIQKYLFTTSSLSVFLFPPETTDKDGARRVCSESEILDDPMCIEGGYGQSKWASERLVMQALDFLPGGAIFRPARVSGRSTDGNGPRNDLFASTMIGMKRLGAYPDMDFPYDLTPVDYCAKAMVQIAVNICNAKQGAYDRVYHLFNKDTVPFRDLFTGMGLDPLPLNEWRELLKRADETQKELVPLTPFFLSKFWDFAPNWPVFHTENTDRDTTDGVKELMKPTQELLQTYKTFFGI